MLFFADSYALVAFIRGSENYRPYFVDHEIVTTRMNLFELYYSLLLDGTPDDAKKYYYGFLQKTAEVPDEVIERAAHFRFQNKKAGLSYVDALGYEMSRHLNAVFLTGDNQFKGHPNIEFVKE